MPAEASDRQLTAGYNTSGTANPPGCRSKKPPRRQNPDGVFSAVHPSDGNGIVTAFALRSTKAIEMSGALGEIRTPDPRNRNPMLYPAELRARAVCRLSDLAQQGQQRKPRDFSVPIKNRNGAPKLPDLTRFPDA